MSIETSASASARPLPAKANIEFLKNEAKRRLAAQRSGQPGLKLSTVQFEIAREYGFTRWRALKTALAQLSPLVLEAAGDWIGHLPQDLRVALHVSAQGAAMDSADYGAFGFKVPDFTAGAGRMRLTLPSNNAAFDAQWDEAAGGWRGVWRQDGLDNPLLLTRGAFPPAPVIKGLDGTWEGLLGDDHVRLIFRISTGAYGTHAQCDSPDRSGNNLPVQTVERTGDQVVFRLKTARFEGALSAPGDRLEGTFVRGEQARPLSLRLRAPGDAPLGLPGVRLSMAELAARTGRYRFDVGGLEAEVFVEDGKLSARLSDGRRIGLVPVSRDTFELEQGVGQVVFDGARLTLVSYNRRSEARRMG